MGKEQWGSCLLGTSRRHLASGPPSHDLFLSSQDQSSDPTPSSTFPLLIEVSSPSTRSDPSSQTLPLHLPRPLEPLDCDSQPPPPPPSSQSSPTSPPLRPPRTRLCSSRICLARSRSRPLSAQLGAKVVTGWRFGGMMRFLGSGRRLERGRRESGWRGVII